jgi:IS30 family transposase
VNLLKDLREQDDKQPFYAMIVSLRRNRWPLRAIAEALDVSRSIVNIWETKLEDRTKVPVSEEVPPTINEQVKPLYSRYTIDIDEGAELARLTQIAANVRRFTDPHAPARLAAIELEDRLLVHRRAGASLQQLALVCNVSRRAIAQRLEKAEKREKELLKAQEEAQEQPQEETETEKSVA